MERLRYTVLEAKLQWQMHVLSWLDKADVVVKYEDMVAKPVKTVRESVEALDLTMPMHHGRLPTFAQLHRQWPNFFRKGKVGAWRQDMPGELEEVWWKKNREGMEALGYER